jgi:hypothetical protein
MVAEQDRCSRAIFSIFHPQRTPPSLVSDVEAALDLLENARPDCAIQNAGAAYETAMRISKRLNELGIPYLIQSGHSEQKLPDERKGSGFSAKPIERRRLIESVVAMFGRQTLTLSSSSIANTVE